MIGLYDSSDYYCFADLGDFYERVLRRRYSGFRFFAHFGGRFDVAYIFDHLRKYHPRTSFEFYCAGSSVISFTIHRGDSWWRFTDSYRLLPAGLFKLTHDFEAVRHKKQPFAPTDWQYNMHDCLGLYELLEYFFGIWGVCSETLPAHTMKVWRAFYQDRAIPIPHRDVEDDCRRCYFGGRTEVFRYDEADVRKYDVNSLYPRAMIEPVPVEYIARSRELPDDDRRIGFYHAEVEYPEDVYVPCLPYKMEKLFFPVGRFDCYCTSMELRQAIEDGAKVSIKRGILFLAEPILAPYILDLHAQKQKAEAEGHMGARYVYKIMMNSFYGKFGQGRVRKAYKFDDGSTGLYPLENNPDICWYWTESQSPFIMPHIAAVITARARLITTEWLRLPLRKKGGRIYYTDTDSLYTNRLVPDGHGLGEMAFEGRGRFRAVGLKEYLWEGKWSIKGVPTTRKDPRTGEKVYDGTLAERYMRGEEILIERRAGFMESIRRGLPTARRVIAKRQLARPVPKRCRVGDDTRPWRVDELRAPGGVL